MKKCKARTDHEERGKERAERGNGRGQEEMGLIGADLALTTASKAGATVRPAPTSAASRIQRFTNTSPPVPSTSIAQHGEFLGQYYLCRILATFLRLCWVSTRNAMVFVQPNRRVRRAFAPQLQSAKSNPAMALIHSRKFVVCLHPLRHQRPPQRPGALRITAFLAST